MPAAEATAKNIFWNAHELKSPADRETYLAQACGDDAELRSRVERLLAAEKRSDSFLAPPLAVPLDELAPAEEIGAEIGPYKLLERIGEGGMGVVYMASQKEPIERKVALKIIKPGMDTRACIARFEAERQALALMNHPNIAQVLDAGTVGQAFQAAEAPAEQPSPQAGKPAPHSGRPYFVMELVRGLPITDFCDEHRLGIRDRLELFVSVCRAVQHAHQKGVIHRDLKPTNVLVELHDVVPVPKVIDFGVAKAIGRPLTKRTLHTGFHQMIGTPMYMSPEQAELSGLDVDTRSDIYSLGVLLYELLTGAAPFDRETLQRVGYDEMRRMIREDDPPPPSKRLTQPTKCKDTQTTQVGKRRRQSALLNLTSEIRNLQSEIDPDLDWIVMKCLEKDRNRRYETANGLAMDVQRYLAHEPVVACPPSRYYRLRKFVRRNKGPVLSAAFVLLALVGGIIGTTVGLIRAERARRGAEAAQEALASIIQDIDPLAADNQGVTLAGLLGRRLAEAAQQLDGNSVGDPLVVARLQLVLGDALYELGHLEQAESVLVKACSTRVRLLGDDNLQTVAAKHQLAMLYREQAKYDLAETLYREALKTRTSLLGSDHPDTLTTQHHLALLYFAQRNNDPAGTLMNEVVELRTVRLGADHPDTLTSRHRLALLYRSEQRFDAAEDLCREVLARRTATLGNDHLDTVASKQFLAVLSYLQGKPEVAEPLYKEVFKVRSTKLGADHPDTLTTQYYLSLLFHCLRKPLH